MPDGRSVDGQTRSVSETANLFAQQEANRRRSTWLVVGFILFFAWVGFGGDLAFGLLTADAPPGSYHHVVPVHRDHHHPRRREASAGTPGASAPKRVLWSTGAREVTEPATPEERQLVNVVEEMAIASGQPKPRVWIVPDDDPNAFATGRDAATASIAVTEGLLHTLSRDELQGVIAHEMAHVRNLDIRLMTLLAGMVGAIALMSDGMGRMVRGGARVGGQRALRRVAGPRWRKGRQPAGDRAAGALAAYAGGRAGRLANPRDGREPQARVPGRCHRRSTDPESDGARVRAPEARSGVRSRPGR